jgi:wyosine [tRNA(Phe)-imidazoG37] synthetase (radical SAM superfamily)
MAAPKSVLTTGDHSRDSAGMVYVYPVVSRRAGGVSVGINLSPNNACNWRCIYCQVPDLRRGGPPPVDLGLLERELNSMLDDIVVGNFLPARVPESQRRVVDIAFSGNGEPTSAQEFRQAVELAIRALRRYGLLPGVKLRLITNGSLVDRAAVRQGIRLMGEVDGEVWFKIDAADVAVVERINGVRLRMDSVERRLKACAGLCPTWVQTCMFALDGQLPSDRQLEMLTELLGRCRDSICGVHLYGLARPSAQAEAGRLQAAPAHWLEDVARGIRNETGLTVEVSP